MGKVIAILGAVIVGVCVAAVALGYIVNIFDLVGNTTVFGIEEVLQLAGVFLIPVGAIMGWVVW